MEKTVMEQKSGIYFHDRLFNLLTPNHPGDNMFFKVSFV